MKKKIIATALAAMALAGPIGMATTSTPVSARHSTSYYYKFRKVRITKRTPYYRVIRGKYGYQNRYKKVGYLKPGKKVYIQARGVEWDWTIGKSYKYCTFRDTNDHSWFSTRLTKKTKAKRKVTKHKSTGRRTTRHHAKKRHTVKKPAERYDSVNQVYYDHGIKLNPGERLDFTTDDANEAKWQEIFEHFVCFRFGIVNHTKKAIKASDFINKHIRIYAPNGKLVPLSTDTKWNIDGVIHEVELPDYYTNDGEGGWKTQANNFHSTIYPKKSKAVLTGLYWVPSEKAFDSTFTVQFISNDGKVIGTIEYDKGKEVVPF